MELRVPKGGEFTDEVSDYQHLRKDFTPRNYLAYLQLIIFSQESGSYLTRTALVSFV
jgi:hypothetical protein